MHTNPKYLYDPPPLHPPLPPPPNLKIPSTTFLLIASQILKKNTYES